MCPLCLQTFTKIKSVLVYAHARARSRRPPLDLSLDFILSNEGAFMRSALVSDLKAAASSSVHKRIPRVLRRKRRSPRGASASSTVTPASPPPTRGEQLPQPLGCSEDQQAHGDFEPAVHRDGGRDTEAAAAEREARAVSRNLLRKRALGGARRRPLLVVRVAGAVLAAAGRGVGTVRGRSSRVV